MEIPSEYRPALCNRARTKPNFYLPVHCLIQVHMRARRKRLSSSKKEYEIEIVCVSVLTPENISVCRLTLFLQIASPPLTSTSFRVKYSHLFTEFIRLFVDERGGLSI